MTILIYTVVKMVPEYTSMECLQMLYDISYIHDVFKRLIFSKTRDMPHPGCGILQIFSALLRPHKDAVPSHPQSYINQK